VAKEGEYLALMHFQAYVVNYRLVIKGLGKIFNYEALIETINSFFVSNSELLFFYSFSTFTAPIGRREAKIPFFPGA